ncbi:GntR family transcriptional regulator [Arthrobacter sp. FX8]|uniref:GntR family transcriptional regulator n=1 Tax=Arthrobacter sp. FX8 TaxID=2997335 RepID=UPI00227D45F4|nr:GntR family transcriptional regulator [Arthrobacter sp. FX8]WAJ32994.1 GntR family transcriptional regulator [Arthrobacter sp. FX8]
MDEIVKSESLRAPLKRRGMAQDVAARIREAILSGEIAPGMRINEVEMAASLSVSRGPVRDAIVLLRQEGLLQGDWHRGSRVTVFTNADLEEIYSLRYAIEVLAVKRLTASRSERDLEIIKTRTEAIDRAVEIGDPQQMLQADIAFHDAIYACARHERLEQVWLGLRSQIALLLLNRQRGNDEYRNLISAEHWEMYRVIKDRDTAKAEQLVQDHIQSAFERIKADMKAEQLAATAD